MNPLIMYGSLLAVTMALLGKKKKAKSSSKPTYEYTCSSFKLLADFKIFNKSLYPKYTQLFKEQKITKSNILSLSDQQVIDLSKAWVKILNPSCLKDPPHMTDMERFLQYFVFTILVVKMIQLAQGVSLSTDYVLDSLDLPIIKEEIMGYMDVVQNYLKISYTEQQIAAFVQKLSTTGQIP